MAFDPAPSQELRIASVVFTVAEHPRAPGLAYAQEGGQAVVYQLLRDGKRYALKVPKAKFRSPALVTVSNRISKFAELPGLEVCNRKVLTPQEHLDLLKVHQELTYSILMPWISGPTWLDVVSKKQAINRDESLRLGSSLLQTLTRMEKMSVAHCDLSAPNLILPLLENGSGIALVDVEDMFVPDIVPPQTYPAGSDGYGHRTSPEGQWNRFADRFAGAVLLAEILGWSNASIREQASSESFFLQSRVQHDHRNYAALFEDLGERWSPDVAGLFEQAWRSDHLQDCPSFQAWIDALPVDSDDRIMERNVERQIITLREQAEQMIKKSDYDAALEKYHEILQLAPVESTLASDIPGLIGDLEKKTGALDRPAEPAETGLSEPQGPQHTWEPELPPLEESLDRQIRERSVRILWFSGFVALGVLIFWQAMSGIGRGAGPIALVLAYGALTGFGNMSQLFLLRYEVANKAGWILSGAAAGGILGAVMASFGGAPSSTASLVALFAAAVIGFGVGRVQVRMLDHDQQSLNNIWLIVTAIAWAGSWWIAHLIAWESYASLTKAIAALIVVLAIGFAVVPVVRNASNIEI